LPIIYILCPALVVVLCYINDPVHGNYTPVAFSDMQHDRISLMNNW